MHFDHQHDHAEFEDVLYQFGDSQMLRMQQQLTIAKQSKELILSLKQKRNSKYTPSKCEYKTIAGSEHWD